MPWYWSNNRLLIFGPARFVVESLEKILYTYFLTSIWYQYEMSTWLKAVKNLDSSTVSYSCFSVSCERYFG